MSRIVLLLAALSTCASASVRFGTEHQVLDLRQHDWQYIPEGTVTSPAQAMASTAWKPVRVGYRWDEMGYPELKKGNVWLRLTFAAETNLRDRKVGFFASLIDDEADIFLNGHLISTAKFSLGDLVRAPAIADLTAHLRPGAENILLLRIRDTYVRSPGVIGNVCLFQSLRYQRTPLGGISTQAAGPLSVVLHVGDALLSRGETTSFTAGDLAALSLPPYILREDELILLVPEKEVSRVPAHRVDLAAVNPIRSALTLSVRSAAVPASVPRYGLLDLPLELAATYNNPFDPRQINVQALIETPSGCIDKVPAFFRQDFRQVAPSEEEEILLPATGPAWRVYYRPRELGTHKVEIIAQDRSGIRKHAAGSFQSIASDLPGFLRVSKRDPSFFEYDNGDSFFALGPSGWHRGRDFIFGGNTRWVSSQKLDAVLRAQSGQPFQLRVPGNIPLRPVAAERRHHRSARRLEARTLAAHHGTPGHPMAVLPRRHLPHVPIRLRRSALRDCQRRTGQRNKRAVLQPGGDRSAKERTALPGGTRGGQPFALDLEHRRRMAAPLRQQILRRNGARLDHRITRVCEGVGCLSPSPRHWRRHRNRFSTAATFTFSKTGTSITRPIPGATGGRQEA